MKLSFLSALAALSQGLAAAAPTPASSATTKTSIAIPAGTVVGSVLDGVEYYQGIPFAEPPTGPLRLKPPVRLGKFDTVQATGVGPACPQITTQGELTPLALKVLSDPVVVEPLSLSSVLEGITEDCLTISVMRPVGTAPDAKLPVLLWIYGGAFAVGSAQAFNASVLIPRAVAQDKPFIFAVVNYRLGGFGFLGGSEVLADGSANLGLLDQRMGLEWLADNIAAFGGDPDAVTIWGESAGSISVFDQLALYDGDNTYKNRPLFRAAIMNSGSIWSAGAVDGAKPQAVFDTVVEAAGCSSAAKTDKLACLRGVDYETYLNATNTVPNLFSYSSVSLSYAPRPDGKTLTANPAILARKHKYAAVPIIIGDLVDEGTLFSLFQVNITTRAELISYLNDVFYQNATREEVTSLVDTYPYDNGTAGSPFGTGTSNREYPEFKRLAAVLGDVSFTLTRRVLLDTVPSSVPTWSFLATYNRGTPIVGSFHGSDVVRIFYGVDAASAAIQDRYIAFVHSLDPNDGVGNAPAGYKTHWPNWHRTRKLIEFGTNATGTIRDDFRAASYEYIRAHLDDFRF